MEEIRLADIIIGERFRDDYGEKEMEELMTSIKLHGLIHPIIIDSKNNLVAGGRRYRAMLLLEHETILCRRFGDLSPLQLRELELEENIRRKDLLWHEQVKLIAEIDKLKKLDDPEWKTPDTAEISKVSDRTVEVALDLVKVAEDHPELLDSPDLKTAITRARKFKELDRRAIISADITGDPLLKQGDALELIATIPDSSIDLILFDPPYGIGLDDGTVSDWKDRWGKIYDDDKDSVYGLITRILPEFVRVLKPKAHCYIFFSTSRWLEMTSAVEKTDGLGYLRQPLIWNKLRGGASPDPYHRFANAYEPFFFCFKGTQPKDLRSAGRSNIFDYAVPARKDHPCERPVELYRELIGISSYDGDVILDPMMGSGVSLVAAKQLHRNIIGFELDSDWFNLAKLNISTKGGDV